MIKKEIVIFIIIKIKIREMKFIIKKKNKEKQIREIIIKENLIKKVK